VFTRSTLVILGKISATCIWALWLILHKGWHEVLSLHAFLQLLSFVSAVYLVLASFLSSFFLLILSSFLLSFHSSFIWRELFLNYLLYHVSISFCRQVPIINTTGFLVCRHYCPKLFGQYICVSPIFPLPLNFTQNMFCWSENLNVKPGIVRFISSSYMKLPKCLFLFPCPSEIYNPLEILSHSWNLCMPKWALSKSSPKVLRAKTSEMTGTPLCVNMWNTPVCQYVGLLSSAYQFPTGTTSSLAVLILCSQVQDSLQLTVIGLIPVLSIAPYAWSSQQHWWFFLVVLLCELRYFKYSCFQRRWFYASATLTIHFL
jgi:hypothetical protein